MARTSTILTSAEIEAVEYLASLSPNTAVVTNGSGFVISSSVTPTELGYLSGVTSAIQTQLNGKENSITAGTTAQYWRGDKTWQTLNTTAVTEGTNLYYTAARFNTAFAAKSTTDLAEGTNLYLTNARVIASTLTGYTSGAGTITSADTVLSAIQKLNGNIGAISSHNSLSGLQGGTTSEYYHLTSAEYTGSGTGVFARVASPTFTGTVTGDIFGLNTIKAVSSAGILIEANSGTDIMLLGAGSGAGVTFYGGINGTTASFSGTVNLTGNSSVPTLSSDAYIFHTTTGGLVLMGVGSANDMTVLNSAGSNVWRIATGSINTRFYGHIEPSSNDLCAVGSASRSFSDVFLASGAVVNFNNGDVTITHASSLLTTQSKGSVVIGLDSDSTGTDSVFAIRSNSSSTNLVAVQEDGDIKFSGGSGVFPNMTIIGMDTVDGTDDKRVVFSGGGYVVGNTGVQRGAMVYVHGNEYTAVGGLGGTLYLQAGDTATGDIVFTTGTEVERMRIKYAGGIDLKNQLTLQYSSSVTSSAVFMKVANTGTAHSTAIEIRDAAATNNVWWIGTGAQATTDGRFFVYDQRQALVRTVWDTDGSVTLGATAGTGTGALYTGALSINSNGRITVNNTNESTTLTDFTQSLTNAGILINTEYTANAYTAGLFWATSNDNATVPKAGIWMRETGAGTILYLGTSNNYSAGVTSSVAIDQNGSMSLQSIFANAIGTFGTNGGTTGSIVISGTTSGAVTLSVADTAGSWTMKLPTGSGTSGQVLQTDGSGNTSWTTVSGGTTTQNVVTVRGSHFAYYSDSDYNIPTVSASTFYLSTAGYASYKSGTAQSIAAGTIWASAAANGIILVSGYLYVFLISGGASRIYRCDVTADISASGNWTQLTISGTALPTAASSGIIGFDGTNFWVVDAGTQFMKYTLSGTTLTSNGTVTVTGSSYSLTYSRVNADGIYASFSAAPYIRVASLSGTLDSAKQILVAATQTFANASGFYVLSANSSTDIYSLTNL